MKKMAILFLGMSYPAGIMRYFAQFAVALKEVIERDTADCAVELFFASTRKENHKGAWDVVRSEFDEEHIVAGDNFQEVISGIPKLIDRFGGVVFHYGGGWYQTRALIPYKKRYGRRLKLVATTHSFRHDSWKAPYVSAIQFMLYYLFVDMVIFQCPYAAHKFSFSRLLFKCGKGCIMPLGVMPFSLDKDCDVPAVIREKSLESVLLDHSNFNIVYLAEFRPGKKHYELTKLLLPVMRRHPNVHVLFCGGRNESVNRRVEKLIESAGVRSRFHIPGVIPRYAVPWLLKHVHCAVIASAAETFGHAYVEPMMAGVPVLGTRTGAGEYTLQDYETGFGFEITSPMSFLRQIEFLLHHKHECHKIGKTCRELAMSVFAMDKVAEAHLRLYKSMAQDLYMT